MHARRTPIALLLLVSSAAFSTDSPPAERITADALAAAQPTKGTVLLAVRWDRRWRCGGFENAQLRVIGFDRLPSSKKDDEAQPDLLLDDAPRLLTKPAFDNYALVVEPGEYGLSCVEIKVARSVSDVGFFKVPRSTLLKDGKPLGGAFTVAAGEMVYLGHFYLDCHQQPILWRYYLEERQDFLGYLSKVYPGIDASKVVYRLFETKEFGHAYTLP